MEHEDRKPTDECGNCKFFKEGNNPEKPDQGWCTKRPRLNQKHDNRMYRTNWCQYFEEKAMTTEPIENAVEVPAAKLTDKETSAVITELRQVHSELSVFDDNLSAQLINAAKQGNDMRMMETKGMMLVTSMVLHSLENRINVLLPTVGKH